MPLASRLMGRASLSSHTAPLTAKQSYYIKQLCGFLENWVKKGVFRLQLSDWVK